MRPFERRSIKSRACSRDLLINGLRFFWVIAVIWCEVGIVFYSLSECKWPDKQLQQTGSGTRPTHVLLISDPQVRHHIGKLSWLAAFRQLVSDHIVRKSWSVASRLKPEAVVCLGDMLASGRLVQTDEQYEHYYELFREMFPVDPSIPIHYLPGNNDVGLGRSLSFSKNARRRYVKHFGPPNQVVTVGGHKFILLDAPGLVEEDYQRHAQGQGYDRWTPLPGGPVEFVKTIAPDIDRQPTILFSHIPLAHPETKSCGVLREQGTIRRGVGPGYQNTLDRQSTEFLLETLRPSAVFSGDDRDYCEYTHTIRPSDPDSTNYTRVREVTVKSFSLAQNIRRPGFQLLSLAPLATASDTLASQTIADIPCFLPDQYGIIKSFYIPSILITILILFFSNVYRARRQLRLSPFISPISLTMSPNPSQPSSPSGRSPSGMWTTWPMTPNGEGENDRNLRVSPRSVLPASLRTLNSFGGAPTFRASSQPVTPNDSPLLTPTILFHHDEEDEDTMFPPQYAIRKEHRPAHSGSWPAGYDGEHDDTPDSLKEKAAIITRERSHKRKTSEFLPAPGNKIPERRGWSYSWAFVLRGRRRRMTIRAPQIPSKESLRALASDVWNWRGVGMKRRGLFWGLASDSVSVALPAAIVWGVIVRWMF